MTKLAENGILTETWLESAVRSHLLYGHQQCRQTQSIVYQNKVLGWYEFNGKSYYFYDETDFDGGKHAICARQKLQFRNGDREKYMDLIRTVVLPSTELSLALCIGYTAVVAARLKAPADLGTILVNVCGESTIGKSTAEMLMTSPFMCPIIGNSGKSLSISANNTQNMLYYHMKDVYGVPFVIDDITTNEKIPLSDVVYAITQGEDKGRMNGDGESREVSSWSGVVITSSEAPIMDSIKGDQGLKARVLHTYGIRWTASAEQSTLIKRVVSKNYGFTGKEFAEYVATIPLDDLYERFMESFDVVFGMMKKKDRLSDRLAYKYAAVHLTALLVNEALQFDISADDISKLLISCEQNCFEERDNALKAYKAVVDFIDRRESHFVFETHYSNAYANTESMYKPADYYGKIIKYDTYWEVHLLDNLTQNVLDGCKLGSEIRNIRKEWIKRGWAKKGDSGHNTKQYMYNGKIGRYDCLIIEGGIQQPNAELPPQPVTPLPPTPVSDYAVDDAQAIKDIFGGDSDENAN
jgi:hypothetical protein